MDKYPIEFPVGGFDDLPDAIAAAMADLDASLTKDSRTMAYVIELAMPDTKRSRYYGYAGGTAEMLSRIAAARWYEPHIRAYVAFVASRLALDTIAGVTAKQ